MGILEFQDLCHFFRGKKTSFTKHTNIVLATAFSPDGQWGATGGGNETEEIGETKRGFVRRFFASSVRLLRTKKA